MQETTMNEVETNAACCNPTFSNSEMGAACCNPSFNDQMEESSNFWM